MRGRDPTLRRVGRARRSAISAIVLVAVAGCSAQEATRERREPVAVPSEVQAACDLAHEAAVSTAGVSVARDTGVFGDDSLRSPILACRLVVSGSFALARETGTAADRLAAAFSAQAWQEMLEHAADGKDGTAFAFRSAGVGCHVRGEWNGGADGDPEIPAEDWYTVTVLCTSPPPCRDC